MGEIRLPLSYVFRQRLCVSRVQKLMLKPCIGQSDVTRITRNTKSMEMFFLLKTTSE